MPELVHELQTTDFGTQSTRMAVVKKLPLAPLFNFKSKAKNFPIDTTAFPDRRFRQMTGI